MALLITFLVVQAIFFKLYSTLSKARARTRRTHNTYIHKYTNILHRNNIIIVNIVAVYDIIVIYSLEEISV